MAPVVTVFGGDGSFIDAGSGHAGVWEATGPDSVLHTAVHVFPDANTYLVIGGSIGLDPSGESWNQTYTTMVVAADGTVLNTRSGNVQGRRLHAVPEDEMNAPLDVVPTWTPGATPTS